jgi:hypothetical protein
MRKTPPLKQASDTQGEAQRPAAEEISAPTWEAFFNFQHTPVPESEQNIEQAQQSPPTLWDKSHDPTLSITLQQALVDDINLTERSSTASLHDRRNSLHSAFSIPAIGEVREPFFPGSLPGVSVPLTQGLDFTSRAQDCLNDKEASPQTEHSQSLDLPSQGISADQPNNKFSTLSAGDAEISPATFQELQWQSALSSLSVSEELADEL